MTVIDITLSEQVRTLHLSVEGSLVVVTVEGPSDHADLVAALIENAIVLPPGDEEDDG